jgi:hydroxymethylglutaryl-CoA lyase
MKRFSTLSIPNFVIPSFRNLMIDSMCYPTDVNIIEVGPRDGLQSEGKVLSVDVRKEFIHKINKTGIKNIEIGSFVNEKIIPEMKDSIKLSKSLNKPKDSCYSVLVPNEKKYLEGVVGNKNVDEIVLFVSASDTYNKFNINTNLDDAFKRMEDIVIHAKIDGLKTRGSISCALGCPYEGDVKISRVIDIIERYQRLGVDMIDLSDTTGMGTRSKIIKLLDECIDHNIPPYMLSGHFHDINNSALTLVDECLKKGINTFHTSIGGIDNNPYSSRQVRNLSTEKLLYYCLNREIETNIDISEVMRVSCWIKKQFKSK